jgi:hypothetical protein
LWIICCLWRWLWWRYSLCGLIEVIVNKDKMSKNIVGQLYYASTSVRKFICTVTHFRYVNGRENYWRK